jgi:hypothetical protein
MAMTIILRDKANTDILQQDIDKRPVYPDIIVRDGMSYVLKMVSRDRKTATYNEASILEVQ